VLPEALTFTNQSGQKRFEDVSEEVKNKEELEALLEASADWAIRRSEELEQQNAAHIQPQTQEQQIEKQKKNKREEEDEYEPD
jgi:hypothetical protein